MTRKLMVSTVMALMLVMGVAVVAMAAGPGPNHGQGLNAGPMSPMAGQGQGYAARGDFVDVDGDGLCDRFGDQIRPQDGTGNQVGSQMGNRSSRMGAGEPGANFTDDDGDGVCDNCGSAAGQQQGPKGRRYQDGTGMQRQNGNRANR